VIAAAFHLAPLAGRGRIACSEAKCDPGEGDPPRVHLPPFVRKQPLTPTLSPRRAGRGRREAKVERIVPQLAHHDVVVGLGRTANAVESKALVVGILHAGFHRAVLAPIDRVVEAGGELPDLLGVAVAGRGRRVLDIAARVVVERVAVAERHGADVHERGLSLFEAGIGVEIERRQRVPDQADGSRRNLKRHDGAVLRQRRIGERRCPEAAERAMGAVDLQIQRLGNQLRIDVAAEAAGVIGVVGDVEAIEELAIHRPCEPVPIFAPPTSRCSARRRGNFLRARPISRARNKVRCFAIILGLKSLGSAGAWPSPVSGVTRARRWR
jgi:hypothetical protein